MWIRAFVAVFLLLAATGTSVARAATVAFATPSIDRWNSAVNPTPGYRATASAFAAAAPGSSGFEDLFTTQLLGFDTTASVTAGLGDANYQIVSATLTLALDPATSYTYDPTYDALGTYTSGDPDDPGRPVELYGNGFRGGFTGATYVEGSPSTPGTPWGPPGAPFAAGTRFAYPTDAAGGALPDVSNHLTDGFEATPFAVGQVAGLAAGDLVAGPGAMVFDMVLSADVIAYLQAGLDDGFLGFHVASKLVPVGSGNSDFPSFYNRESGLGASSLSLDLVVVPEPASGSLVVLGLLLVAAARRGTRRD
ncbi:MAG: hypothetical protein AAF430_19570 [Myxococcota bacterium]